MKRLLALMTLVLTVGCAALPPVRVSTRALYFNERQKLQWFDDGPDMVLTVTNETDREVTVVVECANVDRRWEVTVPARSEKRALGQLMNRDSFANPCEITEIR